MISVLTTAVHAGLIVAAMATTLQVNAFAQAAEAGIERTPAAEVTSATPSPVTRASNACEDKSLQTGTQPKVQVGIERLIEIGVERRSNEIRSELLNERADVINFWLAVVAILFAFFGILSIAEFKRLRKDAQNIVDEIKEKRDEVDNIHQNVTAKYADENPTRTKWTIDKALETRHVSLIDKAIVRAVSLQREDKREQASEIWRGIAHVTEDNGLAARAWFSVGYLLGDNHPQKAIRAYDQALRLDRSGAGAYTNRGIAKAYLGRYEEAIADYDKAIHFGPNLVEAYTNRGVAKAKLGRYEEGISDHDKAIRLKPDYALAFSNRGNAKSNSGRYEEAIADFDQAIRLNPKLAEVFYNRGLAKARLDHYEDAIIDYSESIDLNPSSANPYTNRGVAKAQLGRYEEAIADFDQAIRLNPKLVEAFYNRGLAKANLNCNNDAQVDLNTAIDLGRKLENTNLATAAKQALRRLDG